MIKGNYSRIVLRLISFCIFVILALYIGTGYPKADQEIGDAIQTVQSQPVISETEEVIDKVHYDAYSQEYLFPLPPFTIEREESYRLILITSVGDVRGIQVDVETWDKYAIGDHINSSLESIPNDQETSSAQ